MNKNLTTRQDTNLVLKKSKSILNITKKILTSETSLTTEIIEEWILEIWKWADIHNISIQKIPRSKNELLSLISLQITPLQITPL